MSQTDVISIMSDAVSTVIFVSLPMMVVAMVVGLIVSIFQATTQINEQTLAFVPKIISILLTILIAGGYLLTSLTTYFIRHYETITSLLT